MIDLSCFKAYDIRGHVPSQLNGRFAFCLGQAVAEVFAARHVMIGYDARLSGPKLSGALTAGLMEGDVRVTDIGLCGTEEIYYAAANKNCDAGIMITGSHNPADENGFKLVKKGAIPLSPLELETLRDAVQAFEARLKTEPCETQDSHRTSFRDEYIEWLLTYTGLRRLPEHARRLTIVTDAGNGCAGLVLKKLADFLPFDFVHLHAEPDGTFPNGVPNPLLPEKRSATVEAVREHKADFGLAWDGDFDRCFFYDNEGGFIEGYYCVGLLASELLKDHPGAKIVHDPRLYWNTREMVLAHGGTPIMSKTGHAFMKARMRAEDALYGGEMSVHHYFREFAYCDSGMLPWLLMAKLLATSGQSLAEHVRERIAKYPCSGEINRRVLDPRALLQHIHGRYASSCLQEDDLDGISMEFQNWRFNLRPSNTEPLIRLNVESRGDSALLEEKTKTLLDEIDAFS